MKTILYLGPTGHQWWGRDRHGWHLLNGETEHPVWVVTDLAEESFAEIEVPRLFGRDRAAFVARQLANRFPDTPYRSILPHHGGSISERLAPRRQTLLGITASGRLHAELDAIEAPIAGVWPISLLLASFCRSRHLPPELLVVLPRPEALRIVFIKNRVPLLTRLAPTPDDPSAQLEEISRTQRYLENTRLIQRSDHACPVLLLGNPDSFAGQPASALHLISPPPPWDAEPPSDWRFPLFQQAFRSPPGQVAPLGRRGDFVADRLRKGALAASAIGFVAGIAAAGGNVSAIFSTMQQRDAVAATSQNLGARLTEVEREIAGVGVAPEVLHRAIALDTEEITSTPAWDTHLRFIADTLGKSPGLRLKHFEWHLLAASEKPCAKAATAAEPVTAEPAPNAPARAVELAMEVRLPETYGPRDRALALRNFSNDLAANHSLRIIKDPAKELAQGALQGGNLKEVEQNHTWCLSLPDSASTTAKPGGQS
ncbi:MAG: hypothetical protein ACM3SV_06940 [Betaproteobacteria bacterium]